MIIAGGKALEVLIWVDSRVSRLPVVGGIRRRAQDALLDTIFGPAEPFDYVSTTAPSSPPPIIS